MKFKRYYIATILMGLAIFFFLKVDMIKAAWDFWDSSGGEDTVKFLQKYQDYLSYSNFLTSIFSSLGWWIIKGLYFLVDLVEGLIPQSLNLLDFLDDAGLDSITTAIINDLVVALMSLIIVYLGIKTIIAKEPPNFKSVGVNIFISGLLIVGLPSLMDTMEEISVSFYDSTQTSTNEDGTSSLSWNLVKENITDLLYVSSQGFYILDDSSNMKNNLTPKTFKISNLNATITPDVISDLDDNEELKNLAYRLDTNENGEVIADKIKGGAFSFFSDSFDEGYFRYDVNFIPVSIGLIALGFAYLFTIFVFIMTIIEIGFKQVFAVLVFATDLENGQKTKMVMNDILSAFLLIAFTGLSFKMYTSFLTYLGSADLNIVIYLVAMCAATLILIKGSSTIMRYFGVDVGLKDGLAQMVGAVATGKMLGNALSSSYKKGSKEQGKDGMEKDGTENRNEGKSINDSKQENSLGKLKSSINNSGKTLGMSREMPSISDSPDSSTLTMNGLENSNSNATDLRYGMNKGSMLGIDKMNNKQDMKNTDSDQSLNMNNNGLDKLNLMDNSNVSSGEMIAKSNGNSELNSISSNLTLGSSVNSKTNQEILAEMKLKDTMNSNKEMEIPGKVRMESNGNTLANQQAAASSENYLSATRRIEEKPMLNSGTDSNISLKQKAISNGNDNHSDSVQNMRQNVVPGVNGNYSDSVQNVKQNVVPGVNGNHSDSVQNVKQNDVSGVNGNHSDSVQNVKQNVIPGVNGNHSDSVQNVKQNVIGSVAPEVQNQIQQVQQMISSKGFPTSAQTAVQKVLQEVESNPSVSSGEIKTKVLQEVQRNTFSGSAQQGFVQQVERVFSQSEPRQSKVRQVVENVENRVVNTNTKLSNTVDSKVAVSPSSSYGNSPISEILGIQSVEEFEKNRKQRRKKIRSFQK